MKNASESFQFESPVANLIKEAKEQAAPTRQRFYDYHTEILDIEEGWVYEKKRGNKRGKKLRKYFERLGRGWGEDGITFWKPKLNDIPGCEASRWHARQYYANQMKKIISAFDLVLENVPFCCIRNTKDWPGFAWIEFPKYEYGGEQDRGVSWDWWEHKRDRGRNGGPLPDRPESPLKQDVGDAWFAYEDRSRQLRERLGYFETLFHMAIEKEYAQAFYRSRHSSTMLNLVINGRNYLIGIKDGRSFDVIAYPENVITKVLS